VITDIVLPEKDGTELIKYIKASGDTLPVLAITGGVENAAEDYRHYADFFATKTLVKPIQKDVLLQAVKELTSVSG
jgi:DNA-binding response OmpR family regulator